MIVAALLSALAADPALCALRASDPERLRVGLIVLAGTPPVVVDELVAGLTQDCVAVAVRRTSDGPDVTMEQFVALRAAHRVDQWLLVSTREQALDAGVPRASLVVGVKWLDLRSDLVDGDARASAVVSPVPGPAERVAVREHIVAPLLANLRGDLHRADAKTTVAVVVHGVAAFADARAVKEALLAVPGAKVEIRGTAPQLELAVDGVGADAIAAALPKTALAGRKVVVFEQNRKRVRARVQP